MGSTPVTAAPFAAASRGVLPLVRLPLVRRPLAAREAMLCVLAMFPAPIQIAPEAT